MASNYTRYIEFKVKGQELTRAVDRIFKGVNKIEIGVEKVNKKAKITGDVIKDVEKNVKKADTAVQRLAKDFEKVNKAAQRTQTSIGKMLDKLRGGSGGGILRTVAEFGALEVVVRKVVPALTQFAAAHSGLLTATAAVGAAFKIGIPTIYSWGKAVRQAEQSTRDFIRTASSAGVGKAVKGLFPAGSHLGGNRDVAAEKAAAEALKRKAEESKKLEKSTEKVAKTYKLVATGLNKIKERLEQARKIQSQLLSDSRGYENVQKKILGIEKELTKEEKKRTDIRNRMTRVERAGKGAMNLLGGKLGITKGLTEGIAAYGALDAAIRKVSNRFNKQIGLFKVLKVGGSTFWKTLEKVKASALKAFSGLVKYEQALYQIIKSHPIATQSLAGFTAGLATTVKFAPQVYNLGKAFRQVTHDIGIAHERIRKFGLEKGLLSFAPKGSHMGNRFDKKYGQMGEFASSPIGTGSARGLTRVNPRAIQEEVNGLNKVNRELRRAQDIQNNINASVKGPYLQSVIAVRKAQTVVNHELLRSKIIQSAFTADIWAAKAGWQALTGIIKGATGILGGLLGGKVGKLGQAAAVVGISDAVKRLAQHIPLISQAWKDNLQTFAAWTQRITEGLTAVTIAHTIFTKGIAAANWTTGAIKGFAEFEKAAFATFHRVNAGRINLDRQMAARLAKGENMFTGIGKWLKGGEKRIEEKEAIYREDTRYKKINAEIEKQRGKLKLRNETEREYLTIQERIIRLEEIRTKIVNRQRRAKVLAGADPEVVFKDEFSTRNSALEKYQSKFDSYVKERKNLVQGEIANETRLRIAAADKVHKREMAFRKKLNQAQEYFFDLELQRRAKETATRRDLTSYRRRAQVSTLRNRQRRGQLMGEGLMLGAGFPLLFGGGLGSVGGGVAGAAFQATRKKATGGFGAQIIASAIGQQFDAFAAKTVELGKALDLTRGNVETVTAAIGASDTRFGDQLKKLEELEGKEAALIVARARMIQLIGTKGVKALEDFGDSAGELGREWSIAITMMQAGLAKLIQQSKIFVGLSSQLAKANLWRQANRSDNPVIKDLLKELNQAQKGFLLGNMTPGRSKQGRSVSEIQDLIRQEQTRDNLGQQVDLSGRNFGTQLNKTLNPLSEKKRELEMVLELGTREAGIQQQIAEKVKEQGFTIGTINAGTLERIENEVRLNTELQEQVEAWTQIKDLLATEISNAVMGLIDGTKTLKESLAGILRQMAQLIIQKQIAGMIDKIPSPFPSKKKAAGGPVTGGETYLVGEKGPEIFTPGRSGGIIPNHAIGGNSNVTINVDAGGSSMQGDAEQAGQLGRMLAAAVQDEMARQKRPGGILY